MASIEEVRTQIRNAARGERNTITAETFHLKLPSTSKPVLCSCSDGKKYVIKGSHNSRQLVPDHIVGRIGQLLGAPVGEVCFSNIPAELKAVEPQLSDVGSGICHATLWIPDCIDLRGIDHMDKDYNRERFALLQVLYSWTIANDHQLIYAKSNPFLVYSVDHGHFLNGSTGWTPTSLRQIVPVVLDQFFSTCGLPESVMATAKTRLVQITDEDIQLIAKELPDEWAVTIDDRAAITEYLVTRRDTLLTLLP